MREIAWATCIALTFWLGWVVGTGQKSDVVATQQQGIEHLVDELAVKTALVRADAYMTYCEAVLGLNEVVEEEKRQLITDMVDGEGSYEFETEREERE